MKDVVQGKGQSSWPLCVCMHVSRVIFYLGGMCQGYWPCFIHLHTLARPLQSNQSMQRVPDAYLLNNDIPTLWNPNFNTGIFRGPRFPGRYCPQFSNWCVQLTQIKLKVIICLQTPNWCDLADVNYLSAHLAPQPCIVVETHLLTAWLHVRLWPQHVSGLFALQALTSALLCLFPF